VRRHQWDELPEEVRAAVRDRCGDVLDVRPTTDGRNSGFAATLVLPFGGRVFCKGARVDSKGAGMCRVEARVGPYLPVRVPRLRWEIETAGWLVLGFDHVEGRHPDFSPGSADIPLVVEALAECAAALTPSPTQALPSLGDLFTRVEPWRRLRENPPAALDPWTRANLTRFAGREQVAAELASGSTLAHTDLHEANILIDREAHVLDWALAKLAAPWVDTSHLVIRLIAAGHTPEQAEREAARGAVWRAAPAAPVSALASQLYGMWEYLRHRDPRPFRDGPTSAARRWAMYRAGVPVAEAGESARAGS
jgi:phosphotransferase family enzyme